jgi:hypothetical protein
VTIDFIQALPESHPEWHNTVMSITDKFTKRVALVAGKNTWDAAQWEIGLINKLQNPEGYCLRQSP